MIILFDIGGTKMRVGMSRDGETIEKVRAVDTPADFEEGMQTLGDIVAEFEGMNGGKKAEKIAGGIAGMLDRAHQNLYYSPNLPGWVGKTFGKRWEPALGDSAEGRILVENDAVLAALGEARIGAGKGFKLVMYLTVSTGVGGARIIDGKIDQKVFSFQPGQQIIDFSSGRTLEDCIGGASLQKRFGKKPKEIDPNDPIWDELAKDLATGLYNSILHWSPEVIVLGGSMILGEPAISLEKVEAHLRKLLKFFPETPILRKASLGDEGGLQGALLFAKEA